MAVSYKRHTQLYNVLAFQTLTTKHVQMKRSHGLIIWSCQIQHLSLLKTREWGFCCSFGQFWSHHGLLLLNSSTQTARKLLFSYSCSEMLGTMKCFRDYDLGMICSSKCDDAYMQCIAACGSSDCFVDCNRASIACTEGKIPRKNYFAISSESKNFTFSLSM